MFAREIRDPISALAGVKAGSVVEKALAHVGVATIGSLLCRYPRDWEDRTRRAPLKDFRNGRVCSIVRILAHDWFYAGKTRTLKIFVEDDTARACLVCYNRPFIKNQLVVGNDYLIYGDFEFKYGEIQSSSFDFEPADTGAGRIAPGQILPGQILPGQILPGQILTGQILPIYPLTKDLRMAKARGLVKQALDAYLSVIEDEIPQSIRERYHLLTKARALKAIHFPESMKELEKAKKTIIYEELFYLEVMVGKRALAKRSVMRRTPVDTDSCMTRQKTPDLQNALLDRLPFELTEGQREAVADINKDMDSPYPMARLLQGDVGSGKTLVAFLAALKAVEKGGQAAIMAPTELLARQHAENAAKLLEPLGVNVAFLTGNIKSKGRKQLLQNLASGAIDVAIGTHALFSHDVYYRDLRLVVIDEQHRFGVMQRQAILAKGDAPDLLMMSATPIPRTLAITVFGDLDVSVIKGLPPGRQPIVTHLARESNEGKVYEFVRAQLKAGAQAYFVYPLIEEGELDLKDAVSMEERLATEVFPEYTIALAHSKMDEGEKRLTMDAFRRGGIRILVATSVVEVGVDVPNATCMVIEHAERFGLSALHQLRGRVGRGTAQSYCFLVYSDKYTEDAKARLMVMLEHSDGFVIAEEDLKLRGPGQISGVEQSGYIRLGLADPVEHAAILEKARADAFAMLEADPGLLASDHRRVAEVLSRAPPFNDVGV
ncbi:MAG: ATP-dependent DNA helicase RecG [Treponema sp.]|nr:ATP-dependent DNA helicase RecG [Treponema sp.]